MKREWASFLELNISLHLWETGQAVLKGRIIKYSVYKRNIEKEQEIQVEQKKNIFSKNPEDVSAYLLDKHKFTHAHSRS